MKKEHSLFLNLVFERSGAFLATIKILSCLLLGPKPLNKPLQPYRQSLPNSPSSHPLCEVQHWPLAHSTQDLQGPSGNCVSVGYTSLTLFAHVYLSHKSHDRMPFPFIFCYFGGMLMHTLLELALVLQFMVNTSICQTRRRLFHAS